jgi:hypothetical protein
MGRVLRHPGRLGAPSRLLPWFLLVCVACARDPEDPLVRAARGVSTERIDEVGRRLSDDRMAGRYYASPEADSAALYLLQRLRELRAPLVQRSENLLGSHPASFVHHFNLTLYRLGSGTRLSTMRRGHERSAQLGHDFAPLLFGREGQVSGRVATLRGRLADLRHTRAPVRGRIVIVRAEEVLRPGVPVEAALYAASRALEDMGAAAVLFTGSPELLDSPASTYPTRLPPSLGALTGSRRGMQQNLHADRLALAAQAQCWHEAPERTLPALVVRDTWTGRLQADEEIILQVDLQPEVSLGQNVLVGFRGSRRPNELVVLAAHYDQSGVNPEGEVLNGANDNASGVAALVEVAAALAAVHDGLERSVLLAFLSGEKPGLLGSEMLLQDLGRLLGEEAHPVAMLSLRAVGRNGQQPLFVVGGSTWPLLEAVLERYDRRDLLLGPPLALQPLPQAARLTGSLDLTPGRDSSELTFRRAGIPSLLLNDGLDPAEYGRAEDDWKYVDADKVARVARLVFRTSYDLATDLRPAALPASVRPQ